MRMTPSKRSSLFLFELVIVILFFALSSAVCMRVFAYAKTVSDNSRDLNLAVTEAQSTAEQYKALGSEDFFKAMGKDGAGGGFEKQISDSLTLTFTELTDTGGVSEAHISVIGKNGVIFELDVSKTGS